ncbi:uncharacterized protein PFL1_03821 [Pseudozyma flocculosa PF-1]|uniref:DUF300-domain-containing protein n=2 Tax=Pseudozyma flocculosa TaxID=84751 RepID=A0A5C3EX56_9BASI|nr:uncharacterized protein PFL1_03821 [Pseudozyma flocculosa PF-1]EPQ28518.1 hypothetical protein PFL1_03821 [Pseudozyma flocculosa PF-1]SPO36440.1 uncharacterized protein PSFLO_01911 [Pseudozyma flocculosa]
MLLVARHAAAAAADALLMCGSKQQQQQPPEGGGSGRSLPNALLIVSTLSALFATLFSFYLIWKQLKNYRKPTLQRYVVRLLVMVPIYSIASIISLYSLNLADVIDLIRDLYEAFVIYCFFNLLIEYLGGERSTIILLHGRRPQDHIFPINLFLHPMDASDPYTFLALKRGVLQYVQIKPILAILTVLLKSIGKYGDGKISPSNGYTWISFTYNVSVFLSLYCLGMFWKCLNADLAPFRVTSKFLCVKGIIFFSFWQGLGISILVAAGLIRKIGPVADPEYISLAVQDFMICLEMPIFALGHAYAFSHKDYVDPFAHYAARLPVYYALRDCIGLYDVFSDSLTTVRGTGYGYQTFEPSEGVVHQSLARERRSKAGLRYTQGGKAKYWLPQRGTGDPRDAAKGARHQGPLSTVRKYLDQKRMERKGFAPLSPDEAADVIHDNPDAPPDHSDDESSSLLRRPRDMAHSALQRAEEGLHFFSERRPDGDDDVESLSFDSPSSDEEELYQRSRNLDHGDYAYPNVDVAREASRRSRWRDDDDIVHRRRKRASGDEGGGKGKSREGSEASGSGKRKQGARKDSADGDEGLEQRGKKKAKSPWLAWEAEENSKAAADATADRGQDGPNTEASAGEAAEPSTSTSKSSSASPSSSGKSDADETKRDPYGAVDLVVEDFKAEERERLLERRRGDPALRAGRNARVFKKQYEEHNGASSSASASSPSAATHSSQRPSGPGRRESDGSRSERYAKDEKRMVDAALERLDRVQEGHANPEQAGAERGQEETMVEQSQTASVDPGLEADTPIARTMEPKARTAFRKGALPGSMRSVTRRGSDEEGDAEEEEEQSKEQERKQITADRRGEPMRHHGGGSDHDDGVNPWA